MEARWCMALATAFIVGCGSKGGEPPFSFGDSGSGERVRSTMFHSIHPEERTIAYIVTYPAFDLESVATMGLGSMALMQEVFLDHWVVFYYYDDTMLKYSQVPSRIRIHAFDGSKDPPVGEVINEYHLDGMPEQGVGKYTDGKSKTRNINLTYFEVMHRGMGLGLGF